MTSLFENIGGNKAVEAAVDIFYKKVISDPALSPFFDGINLERQKKNAGIIFNGGIWWA